MNFSGEKDWEKKSYSLSAGSRTLKWVYSKDSSGSSGDDCGWVDFVQWTGENPVPDSDNWQQIDYRYDVVGRRDEKLVDGYGTRYLYDGDHVLAEYDGNNNLLRKFIYGPGIDQPVSMIEVADSSATYYYHYDALGSVIALSDSSGDTVQTYEYSVFGEVAVEDANHTNPYMFAGRRYDIEIGLYYNRARYYNPYTGRFLQTDPIGYGDGMNLYAYCGSNPLINADPTGTVTTTSFDQDIIMDSLHGTNRATPDLQNIHYELANAYISARDSFLKWWSDAKQLGAAFGEGWMDGMQLVTYGGTFGIVGDKAQIDELKKRYGWVSDVSTACGGVATVSMGTATVLEFGPFVWGSAKVLAAKYATGHSDVYEPYDYSKIRFDWNRVAISLEMPRAI